MPERLEVSIFQDLDYTKTFISSVMRTDIENGLGNMMINLMRQLKMGLLDLTYTGRIYTITNPKPQFNTSLQFAGNGGGKEMRPR